MNIETEIKYVSYLFLNGFRGNSMGLVVCLLYFTAAISFIDGLFHRTGERIGIQNDAPVHIPGGSTAGLDE